ncbi:MAG: ATP-binding protein [Eubacteriales bacterium]|nr:ATP-binding protein [Eubacteriales bacterium]
MLIKRDLYLQRLINRQNNGMIKVITGLRRAGKTYILFELFYSYLKEQGIDDSHIIKIALDDRRNSKFLNPDYLCDYVYNLVSDDKMYYILLDEVQLVPDFESVLNSFLHTKNLDVYVTGSNAKFLSKDIITEFRGRGDEVKVYPLSFSEYLSATQKDKFTALNEYMTYGGLPYVASLNSHEQIVSYLTNLFTETYIKDIENRYSIKNKQELKDIFNILASGIGSFTSNTKLANSFKSIKSKTISDVTIGKYVDYIQDSFLIEGVAKYDVKGKKYINSPKKYYFTDLGLRNAMLNFRQIEPTHAMENIIYNQLKIMGFSVDIGNLQIVERQKDKVVRKDCEIDFVANLGSKRYYIQSAYSMPTQEKMEQEQRSLKNISDSFKKIIITQDCPSIHYNEDGILIMSIYDFLLNEESIKF